MYILKCNVSINIKKRRVKQNKTDMKLNVNETKKKCIPQKYICLIRLSNKFSPKLSNKPLEGKPESLYTSQCP